MTPRFPSAGARVPKHVLHRNFLSVVAGSLILAAAGCSHFAAQPISANPTQQQMSYMAEQTALRSGVNSSNEEPPQHCDLLAGATPGVEEIRINHGVVESRQWTLIGNGPSHRWVFVRSPDAAPDGWMPKPGIDKLAFQPPLESALTPESRHFLAYVPVQTEGVAESDKSVVTRDVFGPAQGEFTWHGRKYSYRLTSELPCFPQLP
jgi:hypothetical protein